MERVIEELDEAKAEIEKLRTDLKCKAELSENLKKAHYEQTIQIQQSKSKIEMQAQELNEKAEEISVVRQMCEDLKCSLNEKESIIRRLSSTNDKLRVDSDEKQRKWEDEKQELVLALDEANEKNIDQEQKIHEENRKLEEQLKWKKEQFKHLEEAHEKLRNQLKESKKEWEREKSALIDEICSLQTSLDSQTRISDDLQNRLKICNQALAHEESRRKYMEVEISEFKARFENVFTECQDTKSQLECLTTQRDKEIAALRHSLGTKETFYKEIEYRAGKLEQENQELLASLKELQEAHIQETGNSSSVAKLRNKLKSVEQMHRDCSANLRAKQAEWSSQLQNLNAELNNYRFALESKETAAKELKIELENCHSAIMQLELQNIEASVMLLVLKAVITEVQLNLRNADDKTSLHDKERDENVSLLMRQLEMKNTALSKALKDNQEEHEKVASLLKRVESLELVEQQQLLLQKELERCKEMHQESSRSHLHFKEQVLQTERELKEKIEELSDALEMANAELSTEREKAASLSRKAASLDIIEEKRQLMQKELDRYKEMLEESSRCQLRLEEETLSIELDFQETLREVSDALDSANSELCEEREKAASLLRKVESFNLMEEQQRLMQKELERYKQMLDESSTHQLHLEKQTLQKENDFKEKLQELSDALSRANSELAAKICEGHAVEFELWIWESIAQRLKDDLEENQALRKELEVSLLAQVEVGETIKKEKDSRIDSLQHHIELLEQELKTRELVAATCAGMEKAMSFDLEKEKLLKTMREKDNILEDLQKEIGWLEQESLKRELEGAIVARIGAERIFEHEKENLIQLVEERDHKIDELLQLASSLEQSFNCSLVSLSSEIAEKQAEISFVHEAWEKIAAAEILAQLEIEEKKLMIVELEDDISCVQQKLEAQEQSMSSSQQQALEVEAELIAKQMEMKNLTNLMETKLRTSEALVDELKIERVHLVEDVMKLSTERENLMDCVVGLSDRISQFSDEDVLLAENLERMVQSVDDSGSALDLKIDTMRFKNVKDIENTYPSPTTKRFQAVMEERSPFRELN
ncbi:ATP binding protein, putative [Ricinus communis]|uniref:ATP binding protein, putative n=1 Tax=Ricinus communis TaxID=3988 RepID=B9T612_RICCO|nr:ATP binding protein, putative [Ricinus communis]